MSPDVSQIGVRLPAGLRQRLEEYAKTADISLSELMRRAVRSYVSEGSQAWQRIQQTLEETESHVEQPLAPEVQIYGEWMVRLPPGVRDSLRQIGDALGEKTTTHKDANQFPHFLAQTTTGVWRLNFREPISLALPEMEQIEIGFQSGYIGECNEIAAHLHGYKNAADLTGTAASKILLFPDATNQRVLLEFVRNGYRTLSAPVHVVGPDGTCHQVLFSMLGTVKNGYALDVWGVIQPIDAQLSQVRETNALRLAPEGTWCLELLEPVDHTLPPEAQVEHIFRHGHWGICSHAFASVYGFNKGEKLEGRPLEQFIPSSEKTNRESFAAFIRSGCHLVGAKFLTADRGQGMLVVHTTMFAHINKGQLQRIWGTQQDVTEFL